jgi:hypothetical protein
MIRPFRHGFGMACALTMATAGWSTNQRKIWRVAMSSNDFTYGKELVGNMRDGSQSVPARIHTRVRVTTDLTFREVQEHKGRSHCVPVYIFGHGAELPLHPSLQALGRHYFTW